MAKFYPSRKKIQKPKDNKVAQLDADTLQGFLVACGFSKRVKGSEIVYIRANHHFPDVWVKVYTSIRNDTGKLREKGEDAIRITVAYESEIPFKGRTNFGIYKSPKVLRIGDTQDVIDRMYARMREAYGESNAWLQKHWEILRESKKILLEMAKQNKPPTP